MLWALTSFVFASLLWALLRCQPQKSYVMDARQKDNKASATTSMSKNATTAESTSTDDEELPRAEQDLSPLLLVKEHQEEQGDMLYKNGCSSSPRSFHVSMLFCGLTLIVTVMFLIMLTSPRPQLSSQQQLRDHERGEPTKLPGALLNETSFKACRSHLTTNNQTWHVWMNQLETPPCHDNDEWCPCSDPIVPHAGGRNERKWQRAHSRNVQQWNQVTTESVLDVVFMGDSITEHWVGTDLGANYYTAWLSVRDVWTEYFHVPKQDRGSDDRGRLSSLAMGIGGDTAAQLLFRLTEELPVNRRVDTVWINIGTNQVASLCTWDGVVAGNIAIVEEILRKRPLVKRVVLNSLLPRDKVLGKVVHKINDALACFAASCGPAVEFFNATSLFLNEEQQRDESLYYGQLHPNEAGNYLWLAAVSKQIRHIERELEASTPMSIVRDKQLALERMYE